MNEEGRLPIGELGALEASVPEGKIVAGGEENPIGLQSHLSWVELLFNIGIF